MSDARYSLALMVLWPQIDLTVGMPCAVIRRPLGPLGHGRQVL